MTACDDLRLGLGCYVLDTLDQLDRAELDAHLRDCDVCRSELAELAGLPALLGRLSLQDLGEAVPSLPASDALFGRVMASVRDSGDGADDLGGSAAGPVRRLPRRTTKTLLAAAAAVVILGGGIAAAIVVSSGGPDVHSAAQGSVRMQVTLSSQAAGTALRVAVSGLPTDEHCWLVAVADDGSRESVSDWVATYSGDAQVTGSTSIPVSHLDRLILFGTGDKQLVSMRL